MTSQKNMSLAMVFLFLLVLSLNLGKSLGSETLQTWCVAKPSSVDSLLTNNIDYACDHVDDQDCIPIKVGQSCYNPNTVIQHASFAMNIYYQKKGRHQWNCYFDNSGLISLNNPSFGSCSFIGGEISLDLSSVGKWCVARSGVSNQMLQDNIDYACNHVDCSLIRPGGACYDPNNLISHASIVMNLYYQENGKLDSSCNFSGTGLIVISDPSYGNCKFEFHK